MEPAKPLTFLDLTRLNEAICSRALFFDNDNNCWSVSPIAPRQAKFHDSVVCIRCGAPIDKVHAMSIPPPPVHGCIPMLEHSQWEDLYELADDMGRCIWWAKKQLIIWMEGIVNLKAGKVYNDNVSNRSEWPDEVWDETCKIFCKWATQNRVASRWIQSPSRVYKFLCDQESKMNIDALELSNHQIFQAPPKWPEIAMAVPHWSPSVHEMLNGHKMVMIVPRLSMPVIFDPANGYVAPIYTAAMISLPSQWWVSQYVKVHGSHMVPRLYGDDVPTLRSRLRNASTTTSHSHTQLLMLPEAQSTFKPEIQGQ
nr:outer clamp [Grass carp reovirus]